MSSTTRRADARLPLALLRAIQRADSARELMPDEHPGSIFPRRLGLSGVVEDQIREFRRLRRLRRGVDESRVIALLELVARRRDAADIFTAAGHELAAMYLSGPRAALRGIIRSLPRALRARAIARLLRSAHENFLLASEVSVQRAPLEIRAAGAVTVRAGTYGAACQLYSSLASNLLEMVGLNGQRFVHPECQRRGDVRCVWQADSDA